MATRGKKDLIEIYPETFASREEVEAYSEKMAHEAEMSDRPDIMSPQEEEEWRILEMVRKNVERNGK